MSENPTTNADTQAPTAPAVAPPPPKIDRYFHAMIRHGASDLHMKADVPAKFRLGGAIRSMETRLMSSIDIEVLAFEIMTEQQRQAYHRIGSVDFAYQLGKSDRFRINLFRQRGFTSLAARRVPKSIKSIKELNLPPAIGELASLEQGLVLLAGITGSGKSTTIAAILEQINHTRACHLITLEDPIEFLFEDKRAFVNQREIGIDVPDFHTALKYLMREDPDVILIGEMRDQETFSAAMAAAETGHLVFGTIHASSAAGTLTRILELFPEGARSMVRTSLSFNLQAVVCMKLLPGVNPRIPRVPCCEIMVCNGTIRKLIADARDSQIPTVIKNAANEGMIDFTESLRRLVDRELISAKTAYAVAPNPDELKMRLKGISVSGGGIIG